MTMHEDEIVLADAAARALITDQFSRWAQEPIRRIDSSGTVNAIFRIGERYAARFPLLGTDPDETQRLLKSEARASAEFAKASPFPAPEPAGLGRPGEAFPLPWSVQTWLSGTDASKDDPSGSDAFARDLATLITALRGADTRGRTFTGDNRGGDLHDHDEWVEKCLDKSEQLLDVPRLTALWQHFRDLPRTDPDVMTHGDLIPTNVLVAGCRLAGVLDCGGFAAADPALDVIAGWHLLDDGPRAVFRAELGSDDLEWERSKAWAFVQAMGAVWYYVDTNPAMSRMGRQTLARIVAATPM
ncbi:MAG: aminoglycoside phosphotransferase family protein [Chloroflexi bacterium]|nr:aminoglycoside phosphotransferase family protein [Chloroflexota bacterium]